MNANIKLLDCTLRDGGYINDWEYGDKTIKSIIKSLMSSNVDYVEIGFLKNCDYDADYTLFNNVAEIKKILPQSNHHTKFLVMALHDKYDISKLECNDGTIEGIRVTFHDYDIDEGLEFCRKVIEKGYKCFCNPINIMGYTDIQILEIIEKVNLLQPDGFSIVDTFGSMRRSDLLRIYSLCENNLSPSIYIGLHLHENMSMAYSLAQTFIENVNPSRNVIIDASLYGIGRVPGNLCMELIMDYLNKEYNFSYQTDSILDAIDTHIMPIRKKQPWGYSIAYFLSAKYNLHRTYAEYLMLKGKLNSKAINYILSQIDKNRKSTFDSDYIERLYLDYQNNKIDDFLDTEAIVKKVQGKTLLILSPGNTLNTHGLDIEQFIAETNPVIFTTNFYSRHLPSHFAFFSNMKRFEEYQFDNASSVQTIVTSNIHADADYKLDYYRLATHEDSFSDNCALMLLRFLAQLGLKQVYIAGFDGYSLQGENYADTYFKDIIRSTGIIENIEISNILQKIYKTMDIQFVTPSHYLLSGG